MATLYTLLHNLKIVIALISNSKSLFTTNISTLAIQIFDQIIKHISRWIDLFIVLCFLTVVFGRNLFAILWLQMYIIHVN